MKIEGGCKTMLLDSLCAGTLIIYKSKMYIVTDTNHTPAYRYCVNIETGELVDIPKAMLVWVVEDATLKIGGYYK
jgi:hypothetical protein